MKNLFWKFFISFISIVLISFILLIFFSYYSIDKISKEQKSEQFLFQSNEIITFIHSNNEELFVNKSKDTFELFDDFIKRMATNSNSYIWVVDNSGKLLSSSRDSYDARFFTYNEDTDESFFTNDEYYKSFIDNDNLFFETRIFADSIKNKDEISTSFVNKYNELIFNSYPPIEMDILIYINTSVGNLNDLKRDIILSFIIPFITALGIVMVIVGFFANSLSKPLGKLNKVAISVRSGDYQRRVKDVNRNDEIGQLANNFNKMIDEIETLDKSRLSFISDMSHELRTPMTTINGFITGIIDGTIEYKRQAYYLNLVKDEINRLNRLINNLLLLSRIESEEIKLLKTDFDINTTISKTLANMENIIRDKHIKVEINFDEKVTFVNANEDDIERVLFNLIHNAIKFSEQKSKIRIRTEIKKKAMIYIEDQGIGIDEDELISIWNRFYKTDKSRSADKTGTGLGLSIVKKIISNHDEVIFVDSKINRGTTFYFTLTLSNND
ncbi:MAG: HAMP domain-containing histidine kinase [Clostridiales bacterium]|nr:HAMP domain-containing histidine kinase [Clostridiales bacterium]